MPPSTVSTTVACALSSAARSSGSRAPTARTGCLLRATTGGRSATWSASSAASAPAPTPSTSRSARRPTDASCTSTVAALRRCTPVRGTFSRRSTGAWDSTLSSASRVWTSVRPAGPTSPTAPSTSRALALTLSSWWTSPCTGTTTVVSVSSTSRGATRSLSVTKAPTAWTGSSPTTTTSGRSVACTVCSPRASSRQAPTRSGSRSAPRRPTTAATSTAAPSPTSTLESGSLPASWRKFRLFMFVSVCLCNESLMATPKRPIWPLMPSALLLSPVFGVLPAERMLPRERQHGAQKRPMACSTYVRTARSQESPRNVRGLGQ
mmetsp:Transcript_37014/g.80136  ORF Transcript_37014/g.80136 Transcript_37014/m.80136 type:complete len:321 (-) Transcript_37014:856-1818(-)